MKCRAVTALMVALVLGGCIRPRNLPPPSPRKSAPAVPVPTYWPTTEWRETTPEIQGIDSDILSRAVNQLRLQQTPIHSLLVIRHGFVVLDAYFYPFASGQRHDVASVTKSVTSLLVGVAIDGEPLALRTPVVNEITVENLLAMQSGFDCGFGHNERELAAMQRSDDWVRFAAQLPMRSPPGHEFGYCSPNYHLLSSAIQRATGLREDEFARRALFDPLGIGAVYWPRDPQGITDGWGNLQLAPRDLAKIGFLMLHRGRWAGRQLVSADWIARSTAARVRYGARNLYGLGWWSHPDSPDGFFEAIGRGGQRLSVLPDKDVVVVMTGGGFEPAAVGAMLASAIVADTAIAPNPAGVASLNQAVHEAAEPSDSMLEPTPIHSPLEMTISNRTYRIDTNGLGLERLTMRFGDRAVASARLELRDRTIDLPIGLDGRYRIAEQGIDSIRPGGRGHWRDPSHFVLELDLIGKIDHYTLVLAFERDRVNIEITERTGLMHTTVRGLAEAR